MELGRVESREGFAKGIGQVSHNLGNARALKGSLLVCWFWMIFHGRWAWAGAAEVESHLTRQVALGGMGSRTWSRFSVLVGQKYPLCRKMLWIN